MSTYDNWKLMSSWDEEDEEQARIDREERRIQRMIDIYELSDDLDFDYWP